MHCTWICWCFEKFCILCTFCYFFILTYLFLHINTSTTFLFLLNFVIMNRKLIAYPQMIVFLFVYLKSSLNAMGKIALTSNFDSNTLRSFINTVECISGSQIMRLSIGTSFRLPNNILVKYNVASEQNQRSITNKKFKTCMYYKHSLWNFNKEHCKT